MPPSQTIQTAPPAAPSPSTPTLNPASSQPKSAAACRQIARALELQDFSQWTVEIIRADLTSNVMDQVTTAHISSRIVLTSTTHIMVDLVYTHFAFFRNYQRDVRLRVGLPHASNPSSTDFIPVLELGIQNTAVESAWPEAVNRFVLSQAALDKIHGLLARHDPNIDRLYALNLLFCAVGLAFEPAQSPGERDEFLDLGLEWNAFQGSEGWLGENFRRVCGLDALPKEGPKTGSDSDSDSDSDYDSENTEYGEGEVQMMGAIQDEMWADNSDEGSEEESESEEQDDEML